MDGVYYVQCSHTVITGRQFKAEFPHCILPHAQPITLRRTFPTTTTTKPSNAPKTYFLGLGLGLP